MTQHGTSVVIKQTNDGPGSAEARMLEMSEMLRIVARDQKNCKTEAETTSVYLFSEEIRLSTACARANPSMCWYVHMVRTCTPRIKN